MSTKKESRSSTSKASASKSKAASRKKSASSKASSKKASTKKTSAKKASSKATPASKKKASTKKVATKASSTSKAAPKKASAEKSTTKAAPKKATSKKATSQKKAAPKKEETPRSPERVAKEVVKETVAGASVQAETVPEVEVRRAGPEISVVIPVYNEEGIITSSVEDLVAALDAMAWDYELILCENGSRDATVSLATNLAERFSRVRFLSVGEPNYGKALRLGILEARGQFVVCDEIDLCDMRFYRNAVAILRSGGTDMVVGSKLLGASNDTRGWYRNTASQVLNGMLRTLVGFQGTDTHGLKAFRRDRLLRVVESCKVDRDLFTSELVIRAERSDIRIREIPLEVEEKRRPSINLVRRVPNVLKNMARLVWMFRIRQDD